MVNHPVLCQGISLDGSPPSATPLLVDRPTLNVIPELTADLLDPASWSSVVTGEVACTDQYPGKLMHPAQRSMTIALVEACCDTVGQPPLDPRKIDSAGLVVRRIAQDASGNNLFPQSEAWMQSSDGSMGWVALTKREECQDPDPARRPGLKSGSAVLDQMFAQQSTQWTESTTKIFVATPQVCSAVGSTVLFGTVPTTDPQVASAAPSTALPSDSDLASAIPLLLKQGSYSTPPTDQVITAQFGSTDWLEQNGFQKFEQFLAVLQATVIQYGIFDGTAEGQAVQNAVNLIQIDYWGEPYSLIDLLRSADNVLLGDGTSNAGASFWMPTGWSVSGQAAGAILQAIKGALAKKTAAMTPQTGRFDEPGRLYRVQAFVRAKDTPQCAPRIVWTQPSGAFQIAAWYEAGNQPPVLIPLPDPTAPGALKSFKPNVSFGVPAALQRAMQSSNMNSLMNGGSSSGGGLTVDWICSFSIPIVTICAFFMLNIFLSLLNIIFFWLPFVKICIPIPVPKKS
jgi:hypothetical protein